MLLVSQVKRFDSMLKKADDNSCTLHSLPADSIESLLPIYSSGSDIALIFFYYLTEKCFSLLS